MSRRALTPDQDRQVVDEYTAGKTLRDLAAEYGCSTASIANALQRHGCSYRHPSRKRTEWAPELADEIICRYRDGESVRKLAHRYAMRGSTILDLLTDRGEKRNRQGRSFLTPEQRPKIRELYESGHHSLNALAEQFDCSAPTIARAIVEAGGEIRPPGVSLVWTDEVVRWAVKEYESGRTQGSIATELGVSPRGVKSRLQRAGVAMRFYRNGSSPGRYVSGDGYVLVSVPPDHPMFSMANAHGYIPEHRLVMAEHLGRPLLGSETVHHKNGLKDANAITNLQLRHGSHGKGVVMVCMDCGSHNTVAEELG